MFDHGFFRAWVGAGGLSGVLMEYKILNRVARLSLQAQAVKDSIARGGGADGWAEGWVDRWAEGEGKGGV